MRRDISITFFQQYVNKIDNVLNMICCQRILISLQDIKGCKIQKILFDIPLCYLLWRNIFLSSAIYDFVVYICEILNVFYIISLRNQVSTQDVKENYCPGMTNMRIVINCDPANVNLYCLVSWRKQLYTIREGIVQPHCFVLL